VSWAAAWPRIIQNTSSTQTLRRMNLRTDTTTHPGFHFIGNPGQVHCPASQLTVSAVTICGLMKSEKLMCIAGKSRSLATAPVRLSGKQTGAGGILRARYPNRMRCGWTFRQLICKAGEGVLARLGRVKAEFQMVITRASIFEPSKDKVTRRLEECGIPFWPHGFVTAHCDIEC
jgi:hypothetical protein